ncbi:hypothetical protein K0M31_012960 [Melipona bicolor]|uniref:Uncharacterized protein n=1 Tax=Melipona bicolor TaxID=60889 RepID=A0AA40FJA1_9HYME|nr:hypothetical protein K0M31_012960 [Melipona bicolor]
MDSRRDSDKFRGIYNEKSRDECEQIRRSNNLVVSGNLTRADQFFLETQIDESKRCFTVSTMMLNKSKFAVATAKHYRDWNADENYVQKSTLTKILIPERYIGARANFAEDTTILKLASHFEITVQVHSVGMDNERKHLQAGRPKWKCEIWVIN